VWQARLNYRSTTLSVPHQSGILEALQGCGSANSLSGNDEALTDAFSDG
jgi:hypothetical protein